LNNKPIRFHSSEDRLSHRPFLISPLDDLSKEVVVMKARQQGFTEIFVTKAFYFALLTRCTIVYTMPKWDKAKEIARERIDPMGQKHSDKRFSDQIIERLSGWQSLLFKHVQPLYGGGHSTFLMQAAWKGDSGESTGESTAADILFLDEYDRMNAGVEAAFDESLASSRLGIRNIFSTPTYPNHGIDRKYQQSDKKQYLYKCSGCGKWQPLLRINIRQRKGPTDLIQRLEMHDDTALFPPGTFVIACVKCGKPINRALAQQQWVKEITDHRDISGYKSSQLDCVHISADQIMKKLRKLKPGLGPFHWYVLGEPFLGEGGKLAKDFIYTLVDTSFPRFTNGEAVKNKYPGTKIGFGCDWGKSNWWVVKAFIPGRDSPIILAAGFFYDEGDDAKASGKRAARIAKEWAVDAVVCDFGYGEDRNPEMYNAFGYKFFACDYSGKNNTITPTFGPNPPPMGKSLPICKINRDKILKNILLDSRYHRFSIAPLNEQILELMDKHFRAVVIRVYEDEDGSLIEEAVDIGDDHLLHANNYADIALELTKRTGSAVGSIGDGEYIHQQNAIEKTIREQGWNNLVTGDEIAEMADLFSLLG